MYAIAAEDYDNKGGSFGNGFLNHKKEEEFIYNGHDFKYTWSYNIYGDGNLIIAQLHLYECQTCDMPIEIHEDFINKEFSAWHPRKHSCSAWQFMKLLR